MAIWRHADTPVIQIPNATDGHGWTLDDDGVPLWYEGNCLPNILIEDGRIMDEEESDSEEQEVIEPTVYESDAEDDYGTCCGHIWVIYLILRVFIEIMMIESKNDIL